MLEIEEKKRLCAGEFTRNQNDPEEWGATAWNLRTAANVLFEAYGETWEGPGGEPIHPENEHLDSPATMLYGWAMENMIKGYLVKKHSGFEQARAAKQSEWNGHKLSGLALATGLSLTPEQQLLLRNLEAFIVWAGRYPIPMKWEHYTIPKQYMSGDHIRPTEIGCDGIAILEPFYMQMEDEVFADLRKKFSDLDLVAKS